ncbi:hypothetical protein SKAU_G00213230 [Synaphobranchus kaupii]|uniref:Uncharacterized protein n=1 Tax=Synaphobranchus kaupii TaxID=118154 RepID=A0A9Q1F9B4_SYNKA|nr:hypothetical protein SKAU_G00213230 [Synaphobranchus kaupii]
MLSLHVALVLRIHIGRGLDCLPGLAAGAALWLPGPPGASVTAAAGLCVPMGTCRGDGSVTRALGVCAEQYEPPKLSDCIMRIDRTRFKQGRRFPLDNGQSPIDSLSPRRQPARIAPHSSGIWSQIRAESAAPGSFDKKDKEQMAGFVIPSSFQPARPRQCPPHARARTEHRSLNRPTTTCYQPVGMDLHKQMEVRRSPTERTVPVTHAKQCNVNNLASTGVLKAGHLECSLDLSVNPWPLSEAVDFQVPR